MGDWTFVFAGALAFGFIVLVLKGPPEQPESLQAAETEDDD